MPKAYVKQLTAGPQGAHDDLARLRRFAVEGRFLHRYAPELDETEYIWASAEQSLGSASVALRSEAIVAALAADPRWLESWLRATAYGYWFDRLSHCLQRWIRDEFDAGRRRQYLGFVNLHRTAFTIGCCIANSWDAMAFELTDLCRDTLSIGGFSDGGDECHRRGPYFVLRLLSDAQEAQLGPLPASASDEPTYNAVLQRWREPDEAVLVPLLTAMLDRHTHEARPNSNKAWYDFPWLDEWYVPYEVLAVLRLRQRAGLPIAALQAIDHPLLATPLGRLHEAPPYDDDLLQRLVPRLLADAPGL